MAVINVGDRIREIRKLRRLNQDQLAELALLNRVTIAKYEAGKVEPGAQALVRIADALEVSVDDLLGRSDELVQEKDDESWEIRERLRRDSSYRMLFSAASKATPEQLRAAAAMLRALQPGEGNED